MIKAWGNDTMIKFLIIVMVLAAAAYFLQRYREAKRREAEEELADAWINFYSGYSGGSWGTGNSRRPTTSNNGIGIIRRAEPSGTNSPATGTGTQRTGGSYSVKEHYKIH